MRFIEAIIIVAMETLGLLLVAAGLGFLAARWIGWAGLAVTGVALLASAGLAARQQRAAVKKPAPTAPQPQPPVGSLNGKATDNPTVWSKIFKFGSRTTKL